MQDAKRSSVSDLADCQEMHVNHREQMLDDALEETFPASDAVSISFLDPH